MAACTAAQYPYSVIVAGRTTGHGFTPQEACAAFDLANTPVLIANHDGVTPGRCAYLVGSTWSNATVTSACDAIGKALTTQEMMFVIATLFMAFVIGYRQGRSGA